MSASGKVFRMPSGTKKNAGAGPASSSSREGSIPNDGIIGHLVREVPIRARRDAVHARLVSTGAAALLLRHALARSQVEERRGRGRIVGDDGGVADAAHDALAVGVHTRGHAVGRRDAGAADEAGGTDVARVERAGGAVELVTGAEVLARGIDPRRGVASRGPGRRLAGRGAQR